MNQLLLQGQVLVNLMSANLPVILTAIISLWLIHFINILTAYRLNILGIYPRSVHGLLGIIFSPCLHGNFTHVFNNSILLLILGSFVLLNGRDVFYEVTLVIVLVGGGLVWLVGRRALHIGASGIVMGYWGYLVFNAYYKPTLIVVILAAVSLYYFGFLFLDLFSSKEKVSWEAHLGGLVAGVLAAIV